MSYERRYWEAREGTNLSRFTKSGETSTEVILTNAPTAVTVAGTPFSADAMNNIEAGISDTRAYSLQPILASLSFPGEMSTDNTNIYAVVTGGSVLKKIVISTGAITSLNTSTLGSAWGCAYSGAYVYVSNGTGIKKVHTGTGDVTDFLTGLTFPYGIVCYGTYLYYITAAGAVYKAALAGGTPVLIASGITNPQSIATDGVAIYAGGCTSGGGGTIKKIDIVTGAVSTLVSGLTYPRGMQYVNGVLYVTENDNRIIAVNAALGTWSVILPGLVTPMMPLAIADIIYVSGAGVITPFKYENISPSSILPVSISTANVTLTEDRFYTILLSGALTGNRELILPTTVKRYTIINNCTGAYHVTVKTASGTGMISYTASTRECYCDGVNISQLSNGVKKLTGTSASAQGGGISVSHGLDSTKILHVSVKLEYTAGGGLNEEHQAAPGYQFHAYHTSIDIMVVNSAASSAAILSKPLIILITYES